MHDIVDSIKGVIKYNYPIKKYNSWRVGGTVKCCYWPASQVDFIEFVNKLPRSERIIIVGLGSNVLFPDDNLDATVIFTTKSLTGFNIIAPGFFRFEAGVSCAKIAKIVSREGYFTGAFFAGIPGSMGGALRMNAGAFGGETWQHVQSVEFLHRSGKIELIEASKFKVGYRSVVMPHEGFFMAANLSFTNKSNNNVTSIAELLKKRSLSQPIGSFNCGSVFKNPHEGFAAKYIEECGLKGKRIGGAVISPKHANFIINEDDASSDDIIKLINLAKSEVYDRFKVVLEAEVKIYNNF